jgi:hypothetical protein
MGEFVKPCPLRNSGGEVRRVGVELEFGPLANSSSKSWALFMTGRHTGISRWSCSNLTRPTDRDYPRMDTAHSCSPRQNQRRFEGLTDE